MNSDQAVIKYLLDRYVPTGAVVLDVLDLKDADGRYVLSAMEDAETLRLALRKRDKERNGTAL